MSIKFQVARGGTVLHNGNVVGAGTIIEADKPLTITEYGVPRVIKPMSLKQIEALVRTGYVVPFNKAEIITPQQFTPTPPGQAVAPPLPSDNSPDNQPTPQDKLVVTSDGGFSASSYTNPNPPVDARSNRSPWVLDPDTLQEMSLDQLNVMVKERDSSTDVFTDIEEAKAFLSQDFDK